ncbi:DUF1127 domain-containing protein [Bradyrhizobium sp. ISRA442]|uniref:DUF1127 domain-containing protein n=1 Tax=unclassified Bradyrhizobium TaxID=2631580 RepID=UPI00311B3942
MPPQQTNISSETERDAAGLGLDVSIASPRSVRALLQRYWRAFQERRQRQSLRASLQDLSDRELMDIGLTRAEIDYTQVNELSIRLEIARGIYGAVV